jgi:hypothetical protein
MVIDPAYNDYYVYSAVYINDKQVNWGACPVVWEDNVILQGGIWKKGLTWADGNYHLYENSGMSTQDSQFFEECIYASLNESEETFGNIAIEEHGMKVKWCLLEKEQMAIVLNIPD